MNKKTKLEPPPNNSNIGTFNTLFGKSFFNKNSSKIIDDSKSHNADLLITLKKEVEHESFENFRNVNALLHKTNKINQKSKNKNEFIDDIREGKLLKFTKSVKKEHSIRVEETYQNGIDSLEDTIKSLENLKKLFNY